MFEKNLEMGLLLDFYGDILTERKRDIMNLYYNDDLSLGEIAEQIGVTRQAVRETVKKTETELLFYEEKLGSMRRFAEAQKAAERIRDLCDGAEGNMAPALRDSLQKELTQLYQAVGLADTPV